MWNFESGVLRMSTCGKKTRLKFLFGENIWGESSFSIPKRAIPGRCFCWDKACFEYLFRCHLEHGICIDCSSEVGENFLYGTNGSWKKWFRKLILNKMGNELLNTETVFSYSICWMSRIWLFQFPIFSIVKVSFMVLMKIFRDTVVERFISTRRSTKISLYWEEWFSSRNTV